ncbi:winged helix-turn-helix transcriptional regulator [Halosimplex salinum]|uniref:winged helix-turn-helix transcriptional regulator n=1 Tax=Halosimplex salinum TaxID=1710538 RepID=UPI000F489FC6|nr:helix-turn-helix domain-containing protein [Halosimplex salinum]
MTESDDCVAGWCADEEWCAITCAAGVLSGKWHPVVVHRLLEEGALGFNRLQESVGDVSSTVLSDTLDGLESDGVVDRTVVSEKPFRVEYSLTDRGEDLRPVVAALHEWGEAHARATGCD